MIHAIVPIVNELFYLSSIHAGLFAKSCPASEKACFLILRSKSIAAFGCADVLAAFGKNLWHI